MIKENGFTLIELLITMIVVTILVAVAVPAFNDVVQNNRVTANTNNLVNALAVARSEAIRRREPVTICSSLNLLVCVGIPNWEAGWIVFSDRNSNATIDDPPDTLLRVWESIPTRHTITATLGATAIQFDRLGAASITEVFQLNNPDCKPGQANRERRVTLASTGSVHVERTDCP